MSIFTSMSNYLNRPADQKRFARSNFIRRISDATAVPLSAGLQRANAPIYVQNRPDFHYDLQNFDDFGQQWEAWTHRHRVNVGDLTRLYGLYLNIRQVLKEGVAGDFAELGVYKGNSAKVLSNLIKKEARTLFLFDTFEGFDRRDFIDVDRAQPVAFEDTSLEQVRRFVDYEHAVFVPGYFPESLTGAVGPGSLAFIHIDCDLYAPMKAGLEYFYPKASPGALFMLHDYASGSWPGATKAVDEFLADKKERLSIMPDKSGTAMFRREAA